MIRKYFAPCLLVSGLLILVAFSFGPPAVADPGDDTGDRDVEFVPVSLDHQETVSGEALMISAYSVIFGLLLLYVCSLYRRYRNAERAALDLERRVASRSST